MRYLAAILAFAALWAAGVALAAEPSVDDWVRAIQAARNPSPDVSPASVTEDQTASSSGSMHNCRQGLVWTGDRCSETPGGTRGLSITMSVLGTDGAPHYRPVLRSQPPQPAYRARLSPATVAFTHGAAPLNVQFRRNSARLTQQGRRAAGVFAASLLQPSIADTRFEIAGYTDASGSLEINMAISQARAESVTAFLVAQGVDPSRLHARGYGPQDLHFPYSPFDPRNRVVEAHLLSR